MFKKSSIFIILLLVTFLLVGCDLFGSTETETTVSTPSTSSVSTVLTTVTPTFISSADATTVDTTYSEEDLYDLIQDVLGYDLSDQEAAQVVGMIQSLTDMSSPEELYYQMKSLQESFEAFLEIEDLSDLGLWWIQFKTNAMNQDTFIRIASALTVNSYFYYLNEVSLDDLNDQYDFMNDQYIYIRGQIESINEDIDSLELEVESYANSLATNQIEALNYYYALMREKDYSDNITRELNYLYLDEDFDYLKSSLMIDDLTNYYYFTYDDPNPSAESYMTAYQEALMTVDPSDYSLLYYFNQYELYLHNHYDTINYFRDLLEGQVDANNFDVITQIEIFYSTYVDLVTLNYSYKELSSDYYSMRLDLLDQIHQYELINEYFTYMQEESTELSIENVYQIVYGAIDNIINNMSLETFIYLYNDIYSFDVIGDTYSSDLIYEQVQAILDIALLIDDSIDETEFAGIENLVVDLAVIYFYHHEDLEYYQAHLERYTELVVYIFDQYDDIFANLTAFLAQLSADDIELAYDYIDQWWNDDFEDETAQMYQLAVLVDTLFYDCELDPTLYIDVWERWMIDIAFDYNKTDEEIAQFQDTTYIYYPIMIELAHEVALYDVDNLTPEQVTNLEEFYRISCEFYINIFAYIGD